MARRTDVYSERSGLRDRPLLGILLFYSGNLTGERRAAPQRTATRLYHRSSLYL